MAGTRLVTDRFLFRFFDFNRSLSQRLAPLFPQTGFDLFRQYETTVREIISSGTIETVLDLGSGRSCPYASQLPPERRVRIIGVDISFEEMSENTDVHDKRVADVAREPLPFSDREVDLITSRAVLEHLDNVPHALSECERVLKPGGLMVHLFPNKNAVFAILNRVLPPALASRILHFLQPESRHVRGFRAYYDSCGLSSMCRQLARRGFEIIDIKVSYHSAAYFDFFLPLSLLVSLYELVIYLLRARSLAPYLLIIARKKAE